MVVPDSIAAVDRKKRLAPLNSITIIERTAGWLTTAFEYGVGSETVDAPSVPRDQKWMSAQLPVH
jgi:hypothetical protein